MSGGGLMGGIGGAGIIIIGGCGASIGWGGMDNVGTGWPCITDTGGLIG